MENRVARESREIKRKNERRRDKSRGVRRNGERRIARNNVLEGKTYSARVKAERRWREEGFGRGQQNAWNTAGTQNED